VIRPRKSAKEIFSRRQGEDECADDYISYMRKLATNVGITDNKVIQYAILNGLRPHIAAYVTQQKPETLEAVLEAARIAEVTMPAGPSVGSASSDQLADVQAEVRRLAMKWDKMTKAAVFQSRTLSSSPSPLAHRVTFAQPQGMRQPQPRTSYQIVNNRGMRGRNNGNGPRQPLNPRPRENFFPQQAMNPAGQCQNAAGRITHTRIIARILHQVLYVWLIVLITV